MECAVTHVVTLVISVPIRDAIIASIHRNQGAFEAHLTDIKQQPADVTPNSMTSLRETRYAPDHVVSEANR
jgi:hypothetical protein